MSVDDIVRNMSHEKAYQFVKNLNLHPLLLTMQELVYAMRSLHIKSQEAMNYSKLKQS